MHVVGRLKRSVRAAAREVPMQFYRTRPAR
jgi:hypothetical protein